MNHGARQGLCSPASYETENIELRRLLSQLQRPWYVKVWSWVKRLF